MLNVKLHIIAKKCLDNKGNISKTWATIKEIVPDCKNQSREYSFDDEAKQANEFNVLFANVGRNTYDKTQETLHGENLSDFNDANVILDGVSIFRPQSVDIETVILTIKSLNETRAFGSDGISLKLLHIHVCYRILSDLYYQHLHYHRHVPFFLETCPCNSVV